MKITGSSDSIKALKEFENLFAGADVANLLPILMHDNISDGEKTYYIRGESTGKYFACDQDEKIKLELSCWIQALEQALERQETAASLLKRLSLALYEQYRTQPPKKANQVFARVRRMLLLLEALLLRNKVSDGNPYVDVFRKLDEDTITGLDNLVNKCKGYKIKISEEGSAWWVSFPCLMIVAVAESHCEYRQPFAWEAFSAARARDELQRRWKNIDERILNTCALLIHYQSAVGQLGRGSGSIRFMQRIREAQDKMSLSLPFDELLDALKLFGVVEEARNRTIPGLGAKNFDLPFNTRSYQYWDDVFTNQQFPVRIKKYLQISETCTTDRIVTGAYFRPPYAGLKNNQALAQLERIINDRIRCDENKELSQISLGRTQTTKGPLQDLLAVTIEQITPENFDLYFTLKPLKVPCSFVNNASETILQVLLKDHLAAQKRLFPCSKVSLLVNKEDVPGTSTAYKLFCYLLEVAIKKMGLEDNGRWNEAEITKDFPRLVDDFLYVPYPIVSRITEIVHSLMPESCLNVPITINLEAPVWIHIPKDVPKDDIKVKRILANFLLGTILNRAMSSGLTHGDVDLDNIAIPDHNSPDSTMNGNDWRELIKRFYCRGGYETLLGRYLQDFNAPKDLLTFDEIPLASEEFNTDILKTDAVPVGSLIKDIADYVGMGKPGNQRGSPWLLGIDIGGTLTKCQFYRYENGRFTPDHEVFRMTTADLHKATNIASSQSPEREKEKEVKDRTEAFVARLLKTIHEHSDELVKNIVGEGSVFVIGISWPGPVHQNHAAGTSGIVQNFGLDRDIKKNKIDDIWLIDLASTIKLMWKEKYHIETSKIHITILNDGDAEAVGSLVDTVIKSKSDSLGPNISVVKLGTGLAGGFISQGIRKRELCLMPGLYEWGKLILDCAARPREGFPCGVAADYLSKRCLPELAKRHGTHHECFQRDTPDSLEIGGVLELGCAYGDKIEETYDNLRANCGSILAEKHPLYGEKVDAEIWRRVYHDLHRNRAVDSELLYQVQLALRAADVDEQLREHLEGYGRIRIQRLIGVKPKNFDPTGLEGEANNVLEHENFKNAKCVAETCANILGHYLGDLCVLLHDQLGSDQVILTGGVLSGKTGEFARKSAIDRMKTYGLDLCPIADDIYQIRTSDCNAKPDGQKSESGTPSETREAASNHPQHNQQTDPSISSEHIEHGALGAACYALASYFGTKRQEGLQRIRQFLIPMPIGTKVSLSDEKVTISNAEESEGASDAGREREVNFKEYALSLEDISDFLGRYGPKWGYFEADKNRFVRWEQEE